MDKLLFRPAVEGDLDAVERIYDAIHTLEESGAVTIGWQRGVYPTRATARTALKAGDLYVAEQDGKVIASARINREQVDVYAQGQWRLNAAPDRVLVLHTLTVDPVCARRGIGRAFALYYERMARELGCEALRIDTNERNLRARAMYAALGYTEVGIVPCVFNGISGVGLVLLEKIL